MFIYNSNFFDQRSMGGLIVFLLKFFLKIISYDKSTVRSVISKTENLELKIINNGKFELSNDE